MGGALFWLGAIGVPIVLTFVAASIRAYKDAPQTAATDFVGMLVIFDFVVALDPAPFTRYVVPTLLTNELGKIGTASLLLSLPLWLFCLFEVEPKLIGHAFRRGKFPLKSWLFVWSSSMILIGAHLAILSGRITV